VDIAVIETGMGGKMDATNVIYPIVSVITPISLDHMDYLGDTISKITQQKAGIIKPDVPVILAFGQHPTAKKIIKKKCKELGSEFIDADNMKLDIYDLSSTSTKFVLEDGIDKYRFNLKNVGRHQAQNAATAFYSLTLINELGFKIDYSALKEGINSTVMDSRVQIFDKEKIIIDASHNTEGVYELGYVINELIKGERIVLICSVLKTKDIKEMVFEYSKFTSYAVVTQSSHPLSKDSKSLIEEFLAQNIEGEHFEDIEDAVKKANEIKGEDGYLVVSGSFYMIADVKKALNIK
jgi:dihydrofolate synthase/folylpolyglutamate synthase